MKRKMGLPSINSMFSAKQEHLEKQVQKKNQLDINILYHIEVQHGCSDSQ